MNKKILLIAMIILTVLPIVNANSGHVKLLAVSQTEEGLEGNTADLYLEIKPGSGRVFIDSYPLTKLDTQISTRFAQQVACDFSNADCTNKDFFYVIRAESPIVGGPSAGAAIAALTVSLLDRNKINEKISVTGTINSGDLIGPVGGIPQKIDAAKEAGITTVLIPYGEGVVKKYSEDGKNETINITEYANGKGVEVIEVSDLHDVMHRLTGKPYNPTNKEVEIDPRYKEIMNGLKEKQCSRTKELMIKIDKEKLDNRTEPLYTMALNLTSKGELSGEVSPYASASYCFGANTKISEIRIIQMNLTKDESAAWLLKIEKEINNYKRTIDERGYNTIPELQAYIIVNQRLIEAEDSVQNGIDSLNTTDGSFYLAYSIERLYSAISWSEFYTMEGTKIDFNDEVMKRSCIEKLNEAEERYQYVQVFFPGFLDDTKKSLDRARKDQEDKNYEMCMFSSSKAKAEADALLGVLGSDESEIDAMLENKLNVIRHTLAEEQQWGFPIIGYSYYEYSIDLKGSDKYSSWLYAEYSLEMSKLRMYYKEDTNRDLIVIHWDYIIIFITGVGIGAVLMVQTRKKEVRRKISTKK